MICCNHNCNQGRDCSYRVRRRAPAILKRATATLLAIFTLSGCIHNPPPASDTRPVDVLRITAPDFGGEVNARLHHIRTLDAAGTRVEIDTGTCLSACTFYLSMDDVCVTPDSRFGFHSPLHPISILTNPLLPIPYPGETGDYTRQVMVDMFDHVPPLRAFVAEAVQSGYFSYLTGSEVIAMGIEECATTQETDR